MSRHITIRRAHIAKTIAEACTRYAESMDALLAEPVNKLASEVCLRELMTVLELHEALPIVRILTELRLRCTSCNRGVSYTRASGSMCLGCAHKAKNVREAEAG